MQLPPIWVDDYWGSTPSSYLSTWPGWQLPNTFPIITISFSEASSHFNSSSTNLASDIFDRIVFFINELITAKRWPSGKPFRYCLRLSNQSTPTTKSLRLFRNPYDDCYDTSTPVGSRNPALLSPFPHTGVALHTAISTTTFTALRSLLLASGLTSDYLPSGLILDDETIGDTSDVSTTWPAILACSSSGAATPAGKHTNNYTMLSGTTVASWITANATTLSGDTIPAYNSGLSYAPYQPANASYRARCYALLAQTHLDSLHTAIFAPFKTAFPDATICTNWDSVLSSSASPFYYHPFSSSSTAPGTLRTCTSPIVAPSSLTHQCLVDYGTDHYGYLGLDDSSVAYHTVGYGTVYAYESRYGRSLPHICDYSSGNNPDWLRRSVRLTRLAMRERLTRCLVNSPTMISISRSSFSDSVESSLFPLLTRKTGELMARGCSGLYLWEPNLATSGSTGDHVRLVVHEYLASSNRTFFSLSH